MSQGWTRNRVRVAATAMLLAWFGVAAGFADAGESDNPVSPAEAVTSNQSLAVDPGPESAFPSGEFAPPVADLDRVVEEPASEQAGVVNPPAPRLLRARNDSPTPALLPPQRPVPWFRTGLGALAIVLALIGAAAWGLRRLLPAARSSDGRTLRVVSRTVLSPKHSAALIHLGRRVVLVGLSGDRMQTLTEVTDPEEVAELVAAGSPSRRESNDFEALLQEHAADDHGATAERAPRKLSRSVSVGGPQGLRDLLQKLRAVQGADDVHARASRR